MQYTHLLRIAHSETLRSLYIPAIIVVLVTHALFLVGVAWMLNTHGGSIAAVVNSQDAAEFLSLGQSLLADGNFYLHGVPIPESFRTIGYPAFISAIFALSGGSSYVPGLSVPTIGDGFYVVLVTLALCAAIAGGVIAHTAYLLGSPRKIALLSGILFGLSPAVLFLPVTGMGSDMLFVFLLSIALLLLVRLNTSHRPLLMACVIGAIMGYATLTRPIGQYYAVLILGAIPFFIVPNYVPQFKKGLVAFLVSLCAFAVITGPWLLRNYNEWGHAAFSSIPVYSFAHYNIPAFMSFTRGIPEGETTRSILARIGNPPDKIYRSFAYTDELAVINKEFLNEHLWPYALFHVYKTLPFYLGSGVDVSYAGIATGTGWKFRVSFLPHVDENLSNLVYSGNITGVVKNLLTFWPATVERIVWLVLFALATLSPLLTKNALARKFFLLGICAIALGGILSSPVAQPRYRVAIEPFVWIMALHAAYLLWTRLRAYRKTRVY